MAIVIINVYLILYNNKILSDNKKNIFNTAEVLSKISQLEDEKSSQNNEITNLKEKINSINENKTNIEELKDIKTNLNIKKTDKTQSENNSKNKVQPQEILIIRRAPTSDYFTWERRAVNIKITLDDYLQLDYYVYPISSRENANVIWSSSDTSIASVDNTGKVTATGIGEATITAKTENGKENSVKVNTLEQKITINLENSDFTVGDVIKNEKISVTDNSTKNDFSPYIYTSSNENVAKVDNDGNIYSISAGKCKIKVIGKNNIEDSIDIEVKKVHFELYSYNESVEYIKDLPSIARIELRLVDENNKSYYCFDNNIIWKISDESIGKFKNDNSNNPREIEGLKVGIIKVNAEINKINVSKEINFFSK